MDNQQFQNISEPTTVWVGKDPYLVNSSGVIPLTSGFSALSLGQPSQSLESQNLPTYQGQFYVTSVQESPTKASPPSLGTPRTGLGVYNYENLTASAPNLGFGTEENNNYNHLQFSPQPANIPYSPGLINNQQFPPTFLAGYSTLQNHHTTSADPQYPTNAFHNHSYLPNVSSNRTCTMASGNGNSLDLPPLVSPRVSSSSICIAGDSSYGTVPSPDTSLYCVYSTNFDTPDDNNAAPLALNRPATLPKPKRASVGEVFVQNGNTSPTYLPVSPCYDRPINKEYCLRCGKKVYHMEKLGPIKDCLYHKLCFSCAVCSTILNVKNYHVNPNDMEDINVYCMTHVPANKSATVDTASVGIKGALRAPKLNRINDQIRGGGNGYHIDNETLGIKTAVAVQRKTSEGNGNLKYKGHTYNLDAESMNFKHLRNVPVQNLQSSNKMRKSSWTRNERYSEGVPPKDVIRYDAPVADYDDASSTISRIYYSP